MTDLLEKAARALADRKCRSEYRADFDPEANPGVHEANIDMTWRECMDDAKAVVEVFQEDKRNVVDLLAMAVADISSALLIANKGELVRSWCANYVAAINEFDSTTNENGN